MANASFPHRSVVTRHTVFLTPVSGMPELGQPGTAGCACNFWIWMPRLKV